jgi:hypothetical protein
MLRCWQKCVHVRKTVERNDRRGEALPSFPCARRHNQPAGRTSRSTAIVVGRVAGK